MGQMKHYLMWLEEKGYVELVCNEHDDWDYEHTNTHPGATAALNEYMEERNNELFG